MKQKINHQKIKLDDISGKFKEIKSLAIQYKKDKDLEINTLNEELEKNLVSLVTLLELQKNNRKE